MSNSDEAILRALKATFQIIGDQELQTKLRDNDVFKKVLDEMELPLIARPALLQIIGRIEQHTNQVPHIECKPDEVTSNSEIEKMLLDSFVQIRWSFRISLVMSVILFIVGLILLSISVIRSLSETSVSTATLTIAGLSVADFILLFYKRPWQDISTNLSNTQQLKIIVTSYLSSLSLLQQGETEKFNLLGQLTKNSINLIEDFSEHTSASKMASSSDKLS